MSSLSLKNLSYQYDGQKVIENLDLEVAENEIVCLLGASGCGKTTTLKAVAGLLTPQQGQIVIHGKTMSDNTQFIAPQHRNIGMMFQDYALFPHLSVAQNIAFGLSKFNKADKQERVNEMLELVHLSEFAERYPHELSGGQQQRVAIARALAYKPNLLLLDEPFSNIDAQVRFQLINDIRQIIKDQKVSAIFVSHSKEEAFAFADKLAVMHKGKIAQLGDAKTLFEQPACKEVAEFLGQGIYIPAQTEDKCEFTTSFGKLTSTKVCGNAQGSGQIYIRPAHIQLENGETNDVEILQSRFIGTEFIYQIKVAEQIIEVPVESEHALNINESVTFKIKPHAVNFFS